MAFFSRLYSDSIMKNMVLIYHMSVALNMNRQL